MNDLTISATTVTAAALWLIGGTMTILELFTGVDGGELGIVLAMGGATLTVRGYFLRLCDQERHAFGLGREHERASRIRQV